MKRKIYFGSKFKLLFFLIICSAHGLSAQTVTQTFNYTGGVQTFTIPSCVSTISVEVWGAAGGYGYMGGLVGAGGLGGYAKGTLNVTQGSVLYINVGGLGVNANGGVGGTGGFNGGGLGGSYANLYGGGGGGGASDIRVGGNTLNDRVIVGGGGGGGSYYVTATGGAGGGLTGGTGLSTSTGVVSTKSGYGGTQSAGGANGTDTQPATAIGSPGVFGDGGNAGVGGCSGGGGGGWFGGGGGSGCNGGGGGGGSSYFGGSGVSNGSTTSGVRTGNGLVTFSYTFIGAGVSVSASSPSICSGSSGTLTASNMVSYTWSPGGLNTASISVNPTSNTTYTIEGTNVQGCVSKALLNLYVDTNVPVLTLTNTANSGGICPNSTVVLTASGAGSYTWAGGSTPVTNGVAFGPTAPADYTVSGQNGCGTTTAVTSVSVHPFPTVTPSASSSTLCAGSSLTLTAVGNATNYTWSGGSAPSGNGVGFIPPAATTIYTVIGKSALTCTALATIPVTVYATPNAAPSAAPPQICIGESTTLTASGALTYTWASSTQTVNNSPGSFVVTPSSSGVSTYTVIKGNSTCYDTKVISIITNPLPTVFAMATPNQVCALQPATLSIGGGTSYTWTAPGSPNNFTFTGASPVVYAPSTSVYTVAAFDGSCSIVTTLSLDVTPNPTITVSASSPSICLGQQVTINAFGGNSYTWTAATGTFYTSSIVDSPTTAIAYNVMGDNSFSCTATAQQIVLVYPNPTVSIQVSKPLVCSGGPAILTASGANSYTWDANASNAMTATVTVNPTRSASGVVIYTVDGSYSSTGCQTSKTVQVSVYVPTLAVSGTPSTCIGGQLSLSATGGNLNTYSWNTGTGTFNFQTLTTTLAASAIFTVSASSTSLSVVCPASQTVAVGNYPNPVIMASAERSVVCPKESVQLFASGGLIYNWSNTMSGGTITVIPPAQSNNYVVTATDVNNCVGTATVQIKLQNCVGINELTAQDAGVFVYPNPNNGVFTIKANSEMDLMIVNELGQTVRRVSLYEINHYETSVSGLAGGIYFICGEKGDQQIRQKLIVQK